MSVWLCTSFGLLPPFLIVRRALIGLTCVSLTSSSSRVFKSMRSPLCWLVHRAPCVPSNQCHALCFGLFMELWTGSWFGPLPDIKLCLPSPNIKHTELILLCTSAPSLIPYVPGACDTGACLCENQVVNRCYVGQCSGLLKPPSQVPVTVSPLGTKPLLFCITFSIALHSSTHLTDSNDHTSVSLFHFV